MKPLKKQKKKKPKKIAKCCKLGLTEPVHGLCIVAFVDIAGFTFGRVHNTYYL